MTQKVLNHYRLLLDPVRLEGLWNWRYAAMALRGAGIEMQTGTVCVERLWSRLLSMFPPAFNMSSQWFDLLAKLAYFRHNYQHFHSQANPAWTEEDSMMAEHLEDVTASLFPPESQASEGRPK